MKRLESQDDRILREEILSARGCAGLRARMSSLFAHSTDGRPVALRKFDSRPRILAINSSE
jgi:hypothetical protein